VLFHCLFVKAAAFIAHLPLDPLPRARWGVVVCVVVWHRAAGQNMLPLDVGSRMARGVRGWPLGPG
jgi:hypothetical protein